MRSVDWKEGGEHFSREREWRLTDFGFGEEDLEVVDLEVGDSDGLDKTGAGVTRSRQSA